MHREKWKGRLDIADVVHVAVHISEPTYRSVVELDGGTVLAIDGDMLTLLSGDRNMKTTIHRKYFCSVMYIGHLQSPCLFCGYKEPHPNAS